MFTMKQLFAGANDAPHITSRLRTDVYKFNMQYFARAKGVHNTPVVFELTNRSPELRLADVIPESYLREQLDHVKALMLTPAHASFVQGMTVNDGGVKKFMYPDPSYSDFLVRQTLSDYDLSVRDGQFRLSFAGTWFGEQNAASPWEIAAMAIIRESYVYWYLKRMLGANEITHAEISRLFAAAYQRVVCSAEKFRRALGRPTFANFGLRRPVSIPWIYIVQEVIDEMIPNLCVGVSDVQHSFDRSSSNPIGTRAHEAAMVYANLGDDTDDSMRESQFYLEFDWAEVFPRPLRILLPDCFGSKQFYDHAPAQIARDHAGVRIDSMPTALHDPLYRDWLKQHGGDPKKQLVLPSDGQDADSFPAEHVQFAPVYGAFSAGIGGGWTNDIKGLAGPLFRTPNIVIKASYANGRPCTKIGDAPNGGKVTGPDAAHNARVIRAYSEAGWAEHIGNLAL